MGSKDHIFWSMLGGPQRSTKLGSDECQPVLGKRKIKTNFVRYRLGEYKFVGMRQRPHALRPFSQEREIIISVPVNLFSVASMSFVTSDEELYLLASHRMLREVVFSEDDAGLLVDVVSPDTMQLPNTATVCGAVFPPSFVTCGIQHAVGGPSGWHWERPSPVCYARG